MTDKQEKKILSALATEEGRIKLGRALVADLRARVGAERRKPLCHSLYHSFLGNGVYKDTCPECGWKAADDHEESNG